MNYQRILPYLTFIALTSCHSGQNGAAVTINAPAREQHIDSDSAKLTLLLNSISIRLPFSSTNNALGSIDLSHWKFKRLRNLPFQVNPSDIGGGIIEGREGDSTFNLVDTAFRGNWGLIQRSPTFFSAVIRDDHLYYATIDYSLNLISAIRIEDSDPAGNNHFSASRKAIINKDQIVNLVEQYCVQVDADGNFECDSSIQKWSPNGQGRLIRRDSR